jgi:hypothetical protein
MNIPGLGRVAIDSEGWYRSDAVTVPVLGNKTCHICLVGYGEDAATEDFHAAIEAFLDLDESALNAAAASIFAYYKDVAEEFAGEAATISIHGPDDVLAHVRPGGEILVQRDRHRDRRVYISVECECDWEPEHGLQIVFRDGQTVTKVGPYDGHLTNAAAYARDDLNDVVYHRLR